MNSSVTRGLHSLRLNQLGEITRRALVSWFEDDAPSMGAALAFYTLFAIAPILLAVIWLAGTFLGTDLVEEHVLAQMGNLLGGTGTAAVRALLASVRHSPRNGYSAAAELITLLIGATSVFAELQNALSRIWRTPPRGAVQGLWHLVRARLLSFGLILVLGFLLLVSLLANAGLEGLGTWLGKFTAEWYRVVFVLYVLLRFAITTVLFAMIYKYVPHEQIAWGDVWVGSLVTALLFSAGKFIIVVYLGRMAVTSVYGIAGSFLVLLLWVYYAAQIFLLGAEFTCEYAYGRGSRAGHMQDPQPR